MSVTSKSKGRRSVATVRQYVCFRVVLNNLLLGSVTASLTMTALIRERSLPASMQDQENDQAN
jgi:hypothetical protein